MDGVPNTPSGAPPDAPGPTVTCPACGASVPQARFCGACGADLAAAGPGPTVSGPIAVPAEPAGADPAASAPMASTPPDQPAHAEPVASAAGPGKACSWCDAVSPLDAKACVSCGATFPTPEGDEALERAARARIEEMQKDINKTRSSTWWPFRPR